MVLRRQPAKGNPFKPVEYLNAASFVIGAEASNIINVGVTLKDSDGVVLAEPMIVDVYLSDNADGSTLTGTVVTTVAIGTNGLIVVPVTAGKVYKVKSNAAGLFDLNLTYAVGAKTWYLCVVMPNGKLAISSAIAFT